LAKGSRNWLIATMRNIGPTVHLRTNDVLDMVWHWRWKAARTIGDIENNDIRRRYV